MRAIRWRRTIRYALLGVEASVGRRVLAAVLLVWLKVVSWVVEGRVVGRVEGLVMGRVEGLVVGWVEGLVVGRVEGLVRDRVVGRVGQVAACASAPRAVAPWPRSRLGGAVAERNGQWVVLHRRHVALDHGVVIITL
eukprot:CAMPEP_0179935580 /NCGR_PEP_ID=MMETSP0983-20121128/13164_1 /TAXON_ID=483367 /ORGANISM="non described non described, Strain CCMP 2436" /LENGTH=136 /DNA_ID=CAMNT_0021840835 /DNA_START=96 /DNA_END=506 /DNA_ORIENTATION=+